MLSERMSRSVFIHLIQWTEKTMAKVMADGISVLSLSYCIS